MVWMRSRAVAALALALALGIVGKSSSDSPVETKKLTWEHTCGLSDAQLRLNCAEQRNVVQLWGERDSGTDAVEYLLQANFDVDDNVFQYGFKVFK